jgi:hypothetical protein
VAREADLQRLDFLKVDVEGAEWMVLKGAEQSLRAFRPVIVAEGSAGNFEKAGYSAKNCTVINGKKNSLLQHEAHFCSPVWAGSAFN